MTQTEIHTYETIAEGVQLNIDAAQDLANRTNRPVGIYHQGDNGGFHVRVLGKATRGSLERVVFPK